MPESNSVKYYSPEEEIDLSIVMRRLIRFMQHNLRLLLLLAITGSGLGYVAYKILPRTYEVKMIADSRMLSSQAMVSIVESWQDLLSRGGQEILARKMHLNPVIIAKVRTLEAQPAGNSNPTKQARNVFTITAEVTEPSIVDELQAGIVYYLDNSEFMRERTQAEKQRLSLLKQRIEQEILQLDSVKLSIQNLFRKGGGASNAFIAEPGNINGQIIELYDRLLDVNQDLQFVENVKIVSGFDPVQRPDSPKLSICLVAGLAAGIILAFLIIFFRTVVSQ